MRAALACLIVVQAACYVTYDPTEELSFRAFPDSASAVAAVLEESGGARVYAVGEYHPRQTRNAPTSPLTRFTTEIMELMLPRARHLVIETWLEDGCAANTAVSREVAATTGRSTNAGTQLEALVMKSAKMRLQTHALPMTCIEHGALLDAMGRVDFLRLLELVTEKLGSTARALVESDRAVIVYGGALHNDLYPAWPLETLSYAHQLSADLGGGVIELDLVVPEVVAPMPMVRREGWFPLLGLAAPDRVLLWERGPESYVIILPARDLEARKVALPIAAL
jgi:hypothetical protein